MNNQTAESILVCGTVLLRTRRRRAGGGLQPTDEGRRRREAPSPPDRHSPRLASGTSARPDERKHTAGGRLHDVRSQAPAHANR
jgi:hypothetical protein